jgi:hypothetical protein
MEDTNKNTNNCSRQGRTMPRAILPPQYHPKESGVPPRSAKDAKNIQQCHILGKTTLSRSTNSATSQLRTCSRKALQW